MGSKKRFVLEEAHLVAQNLLNLLKPHCDRVQIAGSIRRKSPLVGDIEILYIPKKISEIPQGEMIEKIIDKSEQKILELIDSGILKMRMKKNGTISFGKRVKLLEDTKSSIPVDLFCCSHTQWWNNLVSRTGGKMTNITIASYTKRLGWNWLPFDEGFINKTTGETFIPKSETDIFNFSRVPYLHPENRP